MGDVGASLEAFSAALNNLSQSLHTQSERDDDDARRCTNLGMITSASPPPRCHVE